jgi:Na+/proline symporter/signal transduction histidine kinase
MVFDLSFLFIVAVAYLLLLFLIAYATEEGWIPQSISKHPATYVLSLGVYATSWSFYGSVGYAAEQGYNFLTIYIGVTLAFLLTPVLLRPIMTLCREYQLTSVADLMSFRYPSRLTGVLVTIFMLVGTLPYIALQIRAVTESIKILTQEDTPDVIAISICVGLTIFAILFGARHISPREKHEGLVVAIAFESVVKLLALLAVGLFAVFGIFGGPADMNQWLAQNPEALERLYQPVQGHSWYTLIILSFAAAFLLPRQFHMIFTENINAGALRQASWAFPLFLLLLNLAIPPVLWAGIASQTPVSADYYVLGITLNAESSWLPLLTFIGGISAASAMVIVTTLALAAMMLNHILLPLSYPNPRVNIYYWLLWGRRFLIGLVIYAGYGFFLLLKHNQGLVELGLISFVAVAQLLPGIIGLLYWRHATRHGFIAGLSGGIVIWYITLLMPLLETAGFIHSDFDINPFLNPDGDNRITIATFWSLAINGLLFIVFSVFNRASDEEQEAAKACCSEILPLPSGTVLAASSPDEFKNRLAAIIGQTAATEEVDRALDDLDMDTNEHRPLELRQLREKIERNLSGLMGPMLARTIIDSRLQTDPDTRYVLTDGIRHMESQLETSQSELRGLARELNELRRYHRQILQDLPMPACSIDTTDTIITWNMAMEILSGISRSDARDRQVKTLPAPWSTIIGDFLKDKDAHIHKQEYLLDHATRSFNLHKAATDNPNVPGSTIVLIEDLTELSVLEAELVHSERLASVGRLAAGVAHEIGNPVTGIACLAQNLIDDATPDDVRESSQQILLQTHRISDIVRALVNFSHSGQTNMELDLSEINLASCVEHAIQLVRLSHSGKQVNFVSHCEAEVSIQADQQRLTQVFVNLLGNACDASPAGSEVTIDVNDMKDHVAIDICDEGTGIREEHLDQIFEPFFTTKEPGQGTGLGLPLAYHIIQDHDGSIQVNNRDGAGACFSIQLPRTTAA